MIINGNPIKVPAHLNFGNFILGHLRNAKPFSMCLENYDTGEQLTFAEFTHYAISLSVGLSELGVKKGDVVGVGSERRITFLPTTLAVVFTGATYTPFDSEIGTAVFNHKLNLARPNYFICTALFWKAYGDIIKSCGFIKTVICFDEVEDVKLSIQKLISGRSVDVENFAPATVEGQTDIAVILYSSGTTGMSKGVPVTHLSLIISCLPNEFQDECVKTALSFGEFHNRYELVTSYAIIAAGRKVVYANNLSADVILKIIQDCEVNSAFLVPSLISYLAKATLKKKNSWTNWNSSNPYCFAQ